MSNKALTTLCLTVVSLIFGALLLFGMMGHNDYQDWQVFQSAMSGKVSIIDKSGPYVKAFATVWTYPRTMEATYSADQGQSMKVTFNDGGTAQVDAFVRFRLPTNEEQRRLLHQEYHGDPEAIVVAVGKHLYNCISASGPVMSASENQASRKAEFAQIVGEQLREGLFKMRRTTTTLDELTEIEVVGTDDTGKKITREKKATVQTTEIVRDADGQPIIIERSPLEQYGIEVTQFSIPDLDYDPKTREQFDAKKESYLNAEKSKAQCQEEVQQQLMTEAKGLRQVAEIEAEENQKKARALIQAQQAAEVAVIEKQRAVTEAQRRYEVAEQLKREADSLKQIASIDAETAELKKKATISQAEAKQKSIELGGGISEEKKVLAEIARDRDIGVAGALAGIKSPNTVISGGSSEGGDMNSQLLSMTLLKYLGVLDEEERQEQITSDHHIIRSSSLIGVSE